MCEHDDCQHSLGPSSHCASCEREIDEAAQELSYNAGLNLRNSLLDIGMTEEKVNQLAKEVHDNILINGVPLRAVGCKHCDGKGWILP